ncbi:EamA family transporter [Streptomyces sp. NPDC019890]|uniref:EamA family transporter n=1 Tax=Streptomyces sp. NPDC019890 TaxID=3365064 RepID=UPI00384C8A26
MAGWGALAILAAAVSYAVAFADMGRKLTGKGTAPMSLSAAQLLTATALSTTALPVGGLESGHISAVGVIAVVILGIFGTGFTFALNYRLIADEGATNAATVGHLLPVVSVALGALLLGEALTFRIVAGMVVVLAGVGLTRWQKRTNSASPLVTAGQTGGSRTTVH